MDRQYPPLNALKAFEAAARHLSFTKAAEELYVTQAAVSHQIKLLENFLSIKLFIRKNRALLLTEQGQAYYLDIRDIFKHLFEATERLLASGAKGTLTVAMPPSFAAQFLVPRINAFNTDHPDIDVRIKAVDFDEHFLTDDVDVAIYHGRGNYTGVFVEKLYDEYLTPMCSPMLMQGPAPLASLSDLRHHKLLHDESRQPWRDWVSHFDLRGVEVNKGAIFSHSMLVLQAAALGQGIALGHSLLAKPELTAGRLICPFDEKLKSRNGYYVVCSLAQAELGKIVAFRQWLHTQVENDG